MFTNTDDHEHLILQIIIKKASSETTYIFVAMEFCQQIIKLQKKDLFFSKIQHLRTSEHEYIRVRKLKVVSE